MNALSSGLFFFLLVICAFAWFIQSLLMFMDNDPEVTSITVTHRRISRPLKMPVLIICNKIPFSNEELHRIPALTNANTLRYMQEWLNPSSRFAPGYELWEPQEQLHAEQLVVQSLPKHGRVQLLTSTFLNCQSVLESCSFKGHRMNAAQCCKSVRQDFATMNGICWTYQNDTHIVSSAGIENEFQITFKVPQYLYQSEAVLSHPGIDVFLVEGSKNDFQLIETMTAPTITLTDKKISQFRMRREVNLNAERGSDCGRTADESADADATAARDNRTNLIPCLLMAVMRRCNCHPVMAEFMDFNSKQMQDELNRTEVCSLDSYDNCARSFMDYARRWMHEEPLPDGISRTSIDVERCRRENHLACGAARYRGTAQQYDIRPRQGENSKDFTAKLSLFYETRLLTEVTTHRYQKAPSPLITACYNFAFWFAVGYSLWSIGNLFVHCCATEQSPKRSAVKPVTVAKTEQQKPRVPQVAPLKPPRKLSASAANLTPAAARVAPPRTLPPISTSPLSDLGTNIIAEQPGTIPVQVTTTTTAATTATDVNSQNSDPQENHDSG